MNKRTTKKIQPEEKLNNEQKADKKQVSPAIANALVIGSQSQRHNKCDQQQIEIGKNESPSDYGSSENVIFERHGKFYIDNPNYRNPLLRIANCISVVALLLSMILILLWLLK